MPISSIREFWQRLEYAVHPDDAAVLNSNEHTFNLDFPPPAFIGDVDNAPVVILMMNGGYDPLRTPTEFLDVLDRTEYLQWLKGQRKEIPRRLSTYYTQQTIFPWIKEGMVVIVNAVAYRSQRLASEPKNEKIARFLPSVAAHRRWLREEVLPAAEKGRRLVIAHRSRLWDFPRRGGHGLENVYHSRCPASTYLSNDTLNQIRSWIRRPD